MEPLMSFEGYQVIENTNKSRNMLTDFYERMGYVVAEPIQATVKGASTNTVQDNKGTSTQR